ncbi:MAG TPA: glycosyltransferase [Planctomycetaceae bacterium]|nr:glycosyltransferase [Planctomycetaceae bacterium]
MIEPDVSVVVCTHNRAAALRDALDSLAAQDTGDGFTFEIVVVDNASTDATADVVREVSAACLIPTRRVFEPHKGIATARNRGVKEARGPWIAFFDDDQLADARWLAELLLAARIRRTRCVGGKVELKLPAGFHRDLSPFCRRLLGASVGLNGLRRYNHRITPGTGNLLVHRSVFEDIGRFDEAFQRQGEDTDLFMRMLAAGIQAWYTPTAIVHHVIPPERLEDAWFLEAATRIAAGVAENERQAWGRLGFPFAWAARVAQAALVLWPRAVLARLSGDHESLLAARCRLAVAGRHLSDGLALLLSGDLNSGRPAC